MKIKKYQKPSGPLPKKSFWWNLANQLSTAPSNGETTIAAHSADLNRQAEQARKEAKGKGQNPDRAEEEVYRRGLRTNGAIVGGAALGALATTVPAVAETVKFATKTPVGKKALQKIMKDTAISMAGGTAVDALSDKMTGMSFGRYVAGAIPGARNLYDRSGLARFGIDMLNPGYLGLSGSKALIEGTQKSIMNLAHKVDNAATIANARLTGKLKFGNPTTYTGIHQSNTPLTKVKFPFNRWDVTTHGADPNGFWLTLAKTPNTEGTMANRPFASRWTATVQKPLIQTGEIENLFKSKNNLRNAIVKYGKRRGADAFEFRGIKDNALPQTDVVMVTEGTDPIYKGGVAQVKYAGPTTGKTTFIKANPDTGYVDLDAIGEYKNLRKQIADQLGLDFKDPNVTNSPEYQKAFNEFITKWSQDINNSGKILYGSSKAMLRSGLPLDNRPFIPDFKTFVIRNQSRNFKENPEQLKAWYDSIIKSNPNIKINNRFISEIPIYSTPKTTIKSFAPKEPLLTETTVPKLSGQRVILRGPINNIELVDDFKIDKYLQKFVTDTEWDKAYNKAIDSGNVSEAKRLFDLHFMTKAPDNKVIYSDGNPLLNYHGTDESFNIFDIKAAGLHDLGDRGRGFYFSINPEVAEGYGKHLMKVYLHGRTPFTGHKDFVKYKNWGHTKKDLIQQFQKSTEKEVDRTVTHMLEQQKDSSPGGHSVLYEKLQITEDMPKEEIKKRVQKYYGNWNKERADKLLGNIDESDVYLSQYENVVYSPNQIKLANLITYDDNGNMIPLSKRHNFNNPDIRYGIIPLSILGGSTILNLNKKPNSK